MDDGIQQLLSFFSLTKKMNTKKFSIPSEKETTRIQFALRNDLVADSDVEIAWGAVGEPHVEMAEPSKKPRWFF